MNMETSLKSRNELLSIAENENNHFLDRLSAYLLLEILRERDKFISAEYVRNAKDLVDDY